MRLFLGTCFLNAFLCAVTFCVLMSSWAFDEAYAQSDWSIKGGDARKREIIRRYKVILEKSPIEGVAFKKLIELTGKGRGLDSLIKEYEDKSQKSPKRFTYRVLLAHFLKAKARYKDALVAYDDAIKINPKSPLAYLGRGATRMMLHMSKDAEKDFEQALLFERDRAKKQQILRQLADLSFAQRNWASAQKYYDQLIKLDKRNEFLRMEYAQVLIKYKRYDKALEQYKALVKLAGRNVKSRATTLRDMASLYENMGNDDEALKMYRKAMSYVKSSNWLYREVQQRIIGVYRRTDRLDELAQAYAKKWRKPGYDQAMILAGLLDELGQDDQALKYYRVAQRKNSRSVDPRLKMIQLLQRRGDLKAVEKEYLALARIAPSQSRYRFELAKLYFRHGDRKKARSMLSNIKRRFRRDADILVSLADTYMRFGMRKEALNVYKALVRTDPKNDAFIMSLGEYHYQNGNVNEALKVWKRILKSNLSKAQAHARLGDVLVEHGMIDKGIGHYEKARKFAPKDDTIMRGMAIAYEHGRRWNLAVKTWMLLMKTVKLPSAIAEARSRIIGLYKRQSRLRTKIREYEEAFFATPPDVESGYFLAESYVKMNTLERAEKVYRKIINLDDVIDKKDIYALTELEKILSKRGKTKESIDILSKLAQLRPLHAKEYYHRIAKLSLMAYEDDQAIRFAKLALEKSPDDATAHARLGEVYARMQRIDDAIKEYRLAIDLDPRAFPHYFSLATLLLERNEREHARRLLITVAQKSFDDQLILQAARKAMAISKTTLELELLEGELASLVFRSPPKGVYRKIMLEIYGRLTSPLIARRDYGKITKEQRAQLERVSARSFPILVDALQSEDIAQRQTSVRMLGDMRQANAALALARLITDEREPMRDQIAAAVARIGDARSSAPLLIALKDSNPAVRELAAWVLGSVGGKNTGVRLGQLLSDGQNTKLQMLAALALGRMRDAKSYASLAKALAASKLHRYSDDLSTCIVWALGMIKDDRAVEALGDVLQKSSGDTLMLSAWALASIGNKAALRHLWEAHWSEHKARRMHATRALMVRAYYDALGPSLDDVVDEQQLRLMAHERRFVDARKLTINIRSVMDGIRVAMFSIPWVDPTVFLSNQSALIASVGAHILKAKEDVRIGLLLRDMSSPARTFGLSMSAAKSDLSARHATLKVIAKPWQELLQKLLSANTNNSHSFYALELLASLEDSMDLDLIRGFMTHQDPLMRKQALHALALGFSSKMSFSRLAQAFEDKHFGVRAMAAKESVHLQASKDLVEALIKLLKDDFALVRIEAAGALEHHKAASAVVALKRMSEDTRKDVQVAAILALSSIGTPEAKEVLKRFATHPDLKIREAVMR